MKEAPEWGKDLMDSKNWKEPSVRGRAEEDEGRVVPDWVGEMDRDKGGPVR